ncbi:hypothetical protein [Singulisphaera acidiphila]|nr:hypothetical protein [Singulisphaera acidiphila]
MIFVVAFVAVAFGGGPAINRLRLCCIERANPHYLMAYLCGNESTLFTARATTCRRWASRGIPWNRATKEAETLRLCPEQMEAPTSGSWLKQAAGWERAALTAQRAMSKQWRVARIYDLWGLWPIIEFCLRIDPFNQGNGMAPLSLLVLFFGLWLGLRAIGRLMKIGWERRSRSKVENPPQLKLNHVDLSLAQREKVERRIAEFIEDSTSIYAHVHETVAKANVLPLLFDWTGFMALRPEGEIVYVPYVDEPGEIEQVHDERLRNMGLFQGTKLHPELEFLLPPKPRDAIACPDCRGSGRPTFPPGQEHLSGVVICSCGGLGWVSKPQTSK